MAPKSIVRFSRFEDRNPDVIRLLGNVCWVINAIIHPSVVASYEVGEYAQIQGHKKSMVNWKYGKIVMSEIAGDKGRFVVLKVDPEPNPQHSFTPAEAKNIERAKQGCAIIFDIPLDDIKGVTGGKEIHRRYTLPVARRGKPDVVPNRTPEPTQEDQDAYHDLQAGVMPLADFVAIAPAAPAVVPAPIQPEPETPYQTPAETPRGRAPLAERPNNENRLSLSPIGRMVAAPFRYGHRAYVTACANSKLRTLKAAVQKNQAAVEAMNAEIACNNEEYDEEEARVNEYLRKANATRVRKNGNLTKSIQANTTETAELLKEIAETEKELAEFAAA